MPLHAVNHLSAAQPLPATPPQPESLAACLDLAEDPASQPRGTASSDLGIDVTEVLDAIDQGFAMFDTEDRLVRANRVYLEIFEGIKEIIVPGVPFETLIRTAAERQQNVQAITDPEAWVQGRLMRHRAASGVYEHKFTDGRWIQVRERRSPAGYTIGTYTDVTSLVERSEQVSQLGAAQASILDCVPQGVVVISADLTVVTSSAHTAQILGWQLQQGDAIAVLESYLGRRPLQEMLRWFAVHSGAQLELDDINTTTGAVVVLRANFMSTGGFVLSLTDVTTQRKAATLASQSQKLVALGQLTGGVAHEFNNLLTSIIGFGRMAAKHASNVEMVKDCLGEVLTAADRAASLTRQMLTFSRKDQFEEKVVLACGVASSLGKMIKPLLPETVQLLVQIDDDRSCVKVDASHLSQALMNLILNARDAMDGGGRVLLRVSSGLAPDGSESPDWLRYTVEDNGSGIDPQHLQSIFDPFFTTKDPGKGTGLGLAVVHGTVQRFGGTVTVDSVLGQGTTFNIYVPLSHEAPDGLVIEEADAPTNTAAGSTILVVEDEPAVRDLVARALRADGHHILVAGDYSSALQVLAQSDLPPVMLLSDVVLPHRSGPEIALALREQLPDLKLLFMSGYIAENIDHQGLITDQTPLLSKPFSPDTLCRRVRDLLLAAPDST